MFVVFDRLYGTVPAAHAAGGRSGTTPRLSRRKGLCLMATRITHVAVGTRWTGVVVAVNYFSFCTGCVTAEYMYAWRGGTSMCVEDLAPFFGSRFPSCGALSVLVETRTVEQDNRPPHAIREDSHPRRKCTRKCCLRCLTLFQRSTDPLYDPFPRRTKALL